MAGRIAFQGELGAYSHQACQQSRPDFEAVPSTTFEEVVDKVARGEVDLGMLAVENSTYGRVADVHSLLPRAGLHIVDEAFVRVHVNLLGVPGANGRGARSAWPCGDPAAMRGLFLKKHMHSRQGQFRQCPRRARGGRGRRQVEGRAGQRACGLDLRAGRAGPSYRGSREQHHALSW
jgi:hypothetical protein